MRQTLQRQTQGMRDTRSFAASGISLIRSPDENSVDDISRSSKVERAVWDALRSRPLRNGVVLVKIDLPSQLYSREDRAGVFACKQAACSRGVCPRAAFHAGSWGFDSLLRWNYTNKV